MSENGSIEIFSNAKVNLTLRITGVLPNGYHTISTLFQEIDLHDILTFTPAKYFELTCSNPPRLTDSIGQADRRVGPSLPIDQTNLITKAYRAMKPFAKKENDWHIHITKNIPVGAGLGGGSSNAAAVLRFLNWQWQSALSEKESLEIAVKIGSDVPFYLNGKTQIGNGVGEILTPVELPESFAILLVCPPIHVSTAWAYNEFDLHKCKEEYKFGSLFSEKRVFWTLFENQFESVVFPAYPEIGEIKERLVHENVLYAGLSGSGSTVFGIFKTLSEAKISQFAKANQSRFPDYQTFTSLPILK